MYTDIAHAVESLKQQGYTLTFELDGDLITEKSVNLKEAPENFKIVQSYTHDAGTDPGSESTIYALESSEGHKGLLIVAYGMYADPSRSALIDRLKKAD
jgi:hypothetical protein